MITIIFFLVVALVLVAYGTVFYIKTKYTRNIAELDEQKNAVFNIPIDGVVLQLKQMHLSGKTQSVYENWSQQWSDIKRDHLPQIEEHLEMAEQSASQLRLLQAKHEIDAAKDLVEDAEHKAFQINEALQVIVESSSSSSQEIDKVNNNYQTLRNKVLTNSATYKSAYASLEKQLTEIEQLVAQFQNLMEEADFIEAKDKLEEVDSHVGALEAKLERIAPLYETYEAGYQDQIEDLKQGHERLVKESYRFADVDIDRAIANLEEKVREGIQDITDLDLDAADALKEEIELAINRLYDVMEAEIAAKDFVIKALPREEARLQQIFESNGQVLEQIDRTSQTYELTDGELETATQFKAELQEEVDQFENFKTALDQHRLVYSQAQARLERLSELLTKVDSKQAEMMKAMGELRQREQFARDQIDSFEFDLRNMKRSLERQHLPGLSQLYLDLFFATSKRIEELEKELNRIKINMKDIDVIVADCTADVEQLDEATETIIDNALMTEQLIQYANRYRMEYASVDKAINVAINLYQYQYKYTQARQTVAKALDEVEAGASKRVEKLYQEDKAKRLF